MFYLESVRLLNMSRIFDTKCRPNKSHNCQLRKGSQKFPQLESTEIEIDIFRRPQWPDLLPGDEYEDKDFNVKDDDNEDEDDNNNDHVDDNDDGDKSNLSRRAILGRHCRADWPWWCRAPATWSSSTSPSSPSPPPPPHGHHPQHLHQHHHHHQHLTCS